MVDDDTSEDDDEEDEEETLVEVMAEEEARGDANSNGAKERSCPMRLPFVDGPPRTFVGVFVGFV